MGSREGAPCWVSGKEGKAGNRWTVPPTKQVLVGQGPVMGTAESEPWAGQDGVCFPSEPLHQASLPGEDDFSTDDDSFSEHTSWVPALLKSPVHSCPLTPGSFLQTSTSISFCDILTQRSHLFVNINTNTYIFILPHPPPTEVYYTHPSKSLFPLARVLWRFLQI